MKKKIIVLLLATLVLACASLVHAQQIRLYRIGFVHEGGPTAEAVVDGLKEGLRELGFEEGREYAIEVRDVKGDRLAIGEVARSLEREKVDLICTYAASVTIEVKRATSQVPIVFAVGGDPVDAGLVESFAKPGGRLTGVHMQQSADLIGKRLEILKGMLPGIHRVVTFYDPSNTTAAAAAKSARDAARQMDIELVERQVASVEELRTAFMVLKAREVDAYFYINDAMVTSQAQFIIDAARTKKLPTMFPWPHLAALGALSGYGVSYPQAGQMMAKYVRRVLTGTSPQNLPVESLSRVELAVNLKTAREIGIAIPEAVLLRADEVIR